MSIPQPVGDFRLPFGNLPFYRCRFHQGIEKYQIKIFYEGKLKWVNVNKDEIIFFNGNSLPISTGTNKD